MTFIFSSTFPQSGQVEIGKCSVLVIPDSSGVCRRYEKGGRFREVFEESQDDENVSDPEVLDPEAPDSLGGSLCLRFPNTIRSSSSTRSFKVSFCS